MYMYNSYGIGIYWVTMIQARAERAREQKKEHYLQRINDSVIRSPPMGPL